MSNEDTSNGGDGQQGLSPAEEQAIATYIALRDALTVAEDMLILAKQGHERNPTPDERRDLDLQILDLAELITRIDEKMTALISRGAALTPPSQAQIDAVKTLAAKVDELTRQSAAASAGIVLGAKVLQMGSDIRFG